MKITSLIIDDEALARQRIKNLLKEVSEIEIIGECKNGKEAIQFINLSNPQLIFLDIQMKDITGFDVLEKVSTKHKPLIIFITAFDKYALKAFDFFAFDYLLKPFRDDRFYKSTHKAIETIKKKGYYNFENKLNKLLEFVKNPEESLKQKNEKLPIKLGNKISFIDTENIKYILASGYYAEIYTEEKKHLLREPLSSLIESLNSNNFIRIHRSTIINIKEINEVISSNYGELDVKMNDSEQFRISKSYKKSFLNKMGI